MRAAHTHNAVYGAAAAPMVVVRRQVMPTQGVGEHRLQHNQLCQRTHMHCNRMNTPQVTRSAHEEAKKEHHGVNMHSCRGSNELSKPQQHQATDKQSAALSQLCRRVWAYAFVEAHSHGTRINQTACVCCTYSSLDA